MKKKSYKITFSLKEGYGPKGRVHDLAEAAEIIKSWLERRLQTGGPLISGLLQEGQLLFPAPGGTAQSIIISPTAIYSGELSSPEDLKRRNKEVRETLESLARRLKTELKQQSVFIIYKEDNWCI